MQFKFQDNLEYQDKAIKAVVDIFSGCSFVRNDNVRDFYLQSQGEGISIIPNQFILNKDTIKDNLQKIQIENKIDTGINENKLEDFTVEMETGTGKTYVYLKTIFELNKEYNLKKFIILVPSVAIREGVIKSISQMKEHFKNKYGVNFVGFGYDSDRLNKVRDFVQADILQIMIMTVQSFNKDTTVMKQSPDRFNGNRPIDLVANTRPIIIMDEPQNMESELSKEAIRDLNPLFKLRYSATHKEVINLVYKLTPIEAYKNGLVKTIAVYGVQEENENEILFKVQEIITAKNQNPTARVILSIKNTNHEYENKEIKIKLGDLLKDKTKNEIYGDLFVTEINARDNFVSLSDNNKYTVQDNSQNKEEIFRVQISETIRAHFYKQSNPKYKDIKVLSLFFIDKVDNYIHNDSLLRKIFNEEFDKLKVLKGFEIFKNVEASEVHTGYFASKKSRDGVEFLESKEKSTQADKVVFDLIMRDKEKLLSFNEKISFIFSHSALKEGWDNPNIFQICTLRDTQSIMKKRQEVGRGLRLPVNQNGDRVYDEKINILTIIPNESYKNFCAVYQSELDDLGYKEKINIGNDRDKVKVKKYNKVLESEDFKKLWDIINKRTKYNLEIKSKELIKNCIEKLNEISTNKAQIRVSGGNIMVQDKKMATTVEINKTAKILNTKIEIKDFINRVSNETSITKTTIKNIFEEVKSREEMYKNYEEYVRDFIKIIIAEKLKIILNDGLKYIPTGDMWEATLYEDDIEIFRNKFTLEFKEDKTIMSAVTFDSDGERKFAESLDKANNIKIWTKLPRGFLVDTPFGEYNPDWAIVRETEDGNKLYLVRETKFYNGEDLEIKIPEEMRKIKSAKKHFDTFNVDFKTSQETDLSDL